MTRDWHETFGRWAKPPSGTEELKAERAARMVREALRAAPALKDRSFDVVAIGSYRNNTNVRAASDVDLAAVLRSAQWSAFPADGSLTGEMLGLRDVSYGLEEFRRDLYAALRTSSGTNDVAPGRIALTVDESSARLAADVTPYLLHRRYTGRRLSDGQWESHDGIETRPAGVPDRRLIQWPDQHHARGVAKNDATKRRYKRVVRILKCLRDEVAEGGASDARAIAKATRSCFLEHAVYNVPNECFALTEGSYYEDLRAVISHLWNVARGDRASTLTEVGGMQMLFRPEESWSPKSLEHFMLVAWQHVGFPRV